MSKYLHINICNMWCAVLKDELTFENFVNVGDTDELASEGFFEVGASD